MIANCAPGPYDIAEEERIPQGPSKLLVSSRPWLARESTRGGISSLTWKMYVRIRGEVGSHKHAILWEGQGVMGECRCLGKDNMTLF